MSAHDVENRHPRAGAQSSPVQDNIVLRIVTTETPSAKEVKDSTSDKKLVPYRATTAARIALLLEPMIVMSSTFNLGPIYVVGQRSGRSNKERKEAQKEHQFQGHSRSRNVPTSTTLELHPSRCDDRQLVFFSDASHAQAQGRAGLGIAWNMDGHWNHFAVPVPVPYQAGPERFDSVERLELQAVELALFAARIWLRNNFDREDIAIQRIFIFTDCRRVLKRLLDYLGDRTGQDELREANRNRDHKDLAFHLTEGNHAQVPRVQWLQNSNQLAADEAWRSSSDNEILNRIMSTAQEIQELYDADVYIVQSAGHRGVEGNERADRAANVGRAARRNDRLLDDHTLLWNRESPAQQIRWVFDPYLSQSSWTIVDGNRTFPVDVPLLQTLQGPTIMSPNIAALQDPDSVRRRWP